MASNIQRRKFLATLLGGAAAWPLAARAQQPKVPTIGALVIGNISPEEFWREFRQGLRDLGYIEGQNIRFEFRSAEGQINRLPELAAELVHLKVDVIVTWFTPTAVAAKQATREIPIVMAETGDPIGTGLVAFSPFPALIRTDLTTPFLQIETEGDIEELGFGFARQPDNAHLRTWELAGAAHGAEGRHDCGVLRGVPE